MSNTPRPSPGNYRSSPENAPRKEPAPAVPPGAPAATATPDAAAPAADPAMVLTPKEAYRKRLADNGMAYEKAHGIFDAVMSKDYYEEYVPVGPANKAVFRTRMYEDHLRLQTALELHRPGLVLTQEDMITRYNLAASLYEWRGVALPHTSDEDFDKVLNLIKRMPAPLYSLLAQKLAVFDQKVMLVFSDGATDSF